MSCTTTCPVSIPIDLIVAGTFWDEHTTDYTAYMVHIDPANFIGRTGARFEASIEMDAGDTPHTMQLVDENGDVHATIEFPTPAGGGSNQIFIKEVPWNFTEAHYYMPRFVGPDLGDLAVSIKATVWIDGTNFTKVAIQRQLISGGESFPGLLGSPEENNSFAWAVSIGAANSGTWQQPPSANWYSIFKKNASDWNGVTGRELRATMWVRREPPVTLSGSAKVGLWNKTTNTLVASVDFTVDNAMLNIPTLLTVAIPDDDPNFDYDDEYEAKILESVTVDPAVFSSVAFSRVDLWTYLEGTDMKFPVFIRIRDQNVGATTADIVAKPCGFCDGTEMFLESSGTGPGEVKLCPLGDIGSWPRGTNSSTFVGLYTGGAAGHLFTIGDLAPNGDVPFDNGAGHGWVFPNGGPTAFYGSYVDQDDNIIATGSQYFVNYDANGFVVATVGHFNWTTEAEGPTSVRARLTGFTFSEPVPPAATITAVKFQMNMGWPTPPVANRDTLLAVTAGMAAVSLEVPLADHSTTFGHTRATPITPIMPIYQMPVTEFDLTADKAWAPSDFTTANFKADIFGTNLNNTSDPAKVVFFFDGTISSFPPRVIVYTADACPAVLTFPGGRSWQRESVTTDCQIYNAPDTIAGGITFLVALYDCVSQGPTAVTIALPSTDCPLPPAEAGVPYFLQLETEGGGGLASWELIGGELPDGLDLSPQGIISGTPTETGTFSITVRVTTV
jgi:hypothetical protein